MPSRVERNCDAPALRCGPAIELRSMVDLPAVSPERAPRVFEVPDGMPSHLPGVDASGADD